jgi:hypothetical protein
MKLEIMGFSQQGLMDLGLDNTDAVLLRWFIDYQGSQRMKAVPNPEDGKVYFWVNFRKLCEDLPIITQSDRWMARRFDKLVSAGVLAKYSSVGPLGKFSAFRIGDGDQYMSLVEAMSLNTAAMSVKSDMGDVNSDRAMSPASDMQSNLNRLPSNNNTGDSQLEDNSCPEPSETEASGKSPAQASAVIQMPLTGSAVYPITQSQIDKWSDLYPAVNVMQELRKMVGWCEGHPAQKKTERGILRFINSWLAREQDRGGKKPFALSSGRTPVSNVAHEGLQGGEIGWS